MRVQPLSQEDALEEGMTTYSSILAWRIPWTEEPSGLQSKGSQRVRHNLPNEPPQQHSLIAWTARRSNESILKEINPE